ncbi:MAG: N-acetylmuramoyl-L-alanine amidase [Candidatus Zixiibacteriota bacterium]
MDIEICPANLKIKIDDILLAFVNIAAIFIRWIYLDMIKKIFTYFALLLLLSIASALEVTAIIDGMEYDIDCIEKDGIEYFSTEELAKQRFIQNRILTKQKRKESFRIFDKLFVFTPFSPFVIIDSDAYSIGVPAYVDSISHYIPLLGFFRAMALALEKDIEIRYPDGEVYSVFYEGDSEAPKDEKDKPSPPPPLPWSDAESQNQLKVTKNWRVVVDPGHGGKDPGAIGKSGLYEKDVVLDISKRIKKLAEAEYPNIKVILTRDGDTFLPLAKRGVIARENRGDIFVSIHCNASNSSRSNGSETFFLSPAKTSDARATELLENKALEYEQDTKYDPSTIAEFILADFAQNEFIRESSRLASKITANISQSGKLRSRGTSHAAFYVLDDNVMPSVLVEVAFISNVEEEKKLKSNEFKDKVAKSVLEGISDFVDEFAK